MSAECGQQCVIRASTLRIYLDDPLYWFNFLRKTINVADLFLPWNTGNYANNVVSIYRQSESSRFLKCRLLNWTQINYNPLNWWVETVLKLILVVNISLCICTWTCDNTYHANLHCKSNISNIGFPWINKKRFV